MSECRCPFPGASVDCSVCFPDDEPALSPAWSAEVEAEAGEPNEGRGGSPALVASLRARLAAAEQERDEAQGRASHLRFQLGQALRRSDDALARAAAAEERAAKAEGERAALAKALDAIQERVDGGGTTGEKRDAIYGIAEDALSALSARP
jgi:chromosome segregation ATPase